MRSLAGLGRKGAGTRAALVRQAAVGAGRLTAELGRTPGGNLAHEPGAALGDRSAWGRVGAARLLLRVAPARCAALERAVAASGPSGVAAPLAVALLHRLALLRRAAVLERAAGRPLLLAAGPVARRFGGLAALSGAGARCACRRAGDPAAATDAATHPAAAADSAAAPDSAAAAAAPVRGAAPATATGRGAAAASGARTPGPWPGPAAAHRRAVPTGVGARLLGRVTDVETPGARRRSACDESRPLPDPCHHGPSIRQPSVLVVVAAHARRHAHAGRHPHGRRLGTKRGKPRCSSTRSRNAGQCSATVW